MWDLDSSLGFGIPFEAWASQSLRPEMLANMPVKFAQSFRVASAADYLTGFASDRSHMCRDDGAFAMPPPQQPCIVSESGETHSLPKWWDMMHTESGYGDVHDLGSFLRHFGARSTPH